MGRLWTARKNGGKGSTKQKKTNYSYIEYLRVLSAFAVIVIHVSGAN